MVKLASKANTMASAVRIPKYTVGIKFENANTEKPIITVMDVK